MRKRDSALVVVDMQPLFDAADSIELVRVISRLVRAARRDQRPVFVVEYDNYGPTDWRILKALSKYGDYRLIRKAYDDGSEAILPVSAYFGVNKYELCGVNYSACVYETAAGLLRGSDHKVSVLKYACGDKAGRMSDYQYRYDDLDSRYDNFVLIEEESNVTSLLL